MQVEKKGLTTAKNAKDYLSKNEIPQLFECLMTGLMYHRPSDHITYLQECLERIKKQGVNGVRWDMFLEAKKTPLPPIDATPREDYRPQPLPDIGSLQLRMPIDASIIIIQTGPGMDKRAICKNLTSSFPNYVQIEVGTVLRERALIEVQDPESRWRSVRDVINDGDLVADEFVTENLIKELNKYSENKHFIIEGYPRTAKEREDFERFIGFNRVKFMLLVDCEEDVCQQKLLERGANGAWSDHNSSAINKRILNYKMNTLAVCKYFDDQNKLRVVDGDRGRDLVMKDIHLVFTNELNETICPHPPSSPKDQRSPAPEPHEEISPGREPVIEIKKLTDVLPENERNPELPQCRFGILLGGPGSGKSEVTTRVCNQHPTWVHFNINEIIRDKEMNTDSPDPDLATCRDNPSFVEDWKINIEVLKEILKSIPDNTEVVIIEGFPKDSDDLNQFNTEIGRADFVILFDIEEDVMRARLAEKFCRMQHAEDDEINSDLRIHHFKTNGLPLCRYYDEIGRMCIVSGDRDILDVSSEFEKVITIKLEVFNDTEAMQRQNQLTEENKIINEEVENAAAVKIQASIRGHLTRKQLNRNTSNAQNLNLKDEDEENTDGIEISIKTMDVDINGVDDVGDEEMVVEMKAEDDYMTEDIVEDKAEEDVVEDKAEEDIVEDKAEEGIVEDKAEEDIVEDKAEEDVAKDIEVAFDLFGDDEDIKEKNEDKIEDEIFDQEEEITNDNDKLNESQVENENESDDVNVVDELIVPVTEVMLGKNGVRTTSQLELADVHVVLLLGGPGSGKTTLGNHLVSKFAIPFIHVDKLIMETESEDENSEEFKKYLLNEECDETPIYSLIRKKMMNSLSESKVIFVAAFPKTEEQYQRFNTDICEIAATIFLDVDEETLKTRLAARADPELPLEYIDQMEIFKNTSPKLLELLNETELFSLVDGTQEIEEVFQQVSSIIENFHFLQNE